MDILLSMNYSLSFELLERLFLSLARQNCLEWLIFNAVFPVLKRQYVAYIWDYP